MNITIYGPGCERCETTCRIVQDTLAEAGVAFELTKVADLDAIAQAGIRGTPAVAVNGQLKVFGEIPTRNEILSWLGR